MKKYMVMLILLFTSMGCLLIGIDSLLGIPQKEVLVKINIFLRTITKEDYFLLIIYFSPLVIYLISDRIRTS
jgi:hypothetical protein